MPRKLMLACRLCGDPVVLSAKRYKALKQAEEQPLCRENGCYRLAVLAGSRERSSGVLHSGTARETKRFVVSGLSSIQAYLPAKKKGGRNGALVKARLRLGRGLTYE